MFSSFGNPPAALWPWGRLSLLQNEYQRYLKGGGLRGELMPPVRRADNLANFVGADWLAVLGASASWSPKVYGFMFFVFSIFHRSKYFPSHCVLRHPSIIMPVPRSKRSSSTPILTVTFSHHGLVPLVAFVSPAGCRPSWRRWIKLLRVNMAIYNFEVRHPRCVGSITKNFCVLHIQLNTTIFHLVVE